MTAGREEGIPRILIVDDNPAIHQDFLKILGQSDENNPNVDEMEAALFGTNTVEGVQRLFEINSAYQGREGLDLVQRALEEGRPYAMAFVDVRMPPGWDGIETLEQIWRVAPDLQAVICTAHSDYTWREVAQRLGHEDGLLILKKPFETVEVLQMAHALTQKWMLTQKARLRMDDLDRMVHERTDELVTANRKLERQIEERTRIQEALRGSEERFSKAFRSAPIPLAILRSDDRRFVDANPAFANMLAKSREEIVDETDLDLQLWSECPESDALRQSPSNRVRNQRCKIRGCNGRVHETMCSAEPIVLDGEACSLLIVEDLTDLLELEGQLRQAQKMESIGLLAAGVAHEFNNILTVIQGNVSLLQMNEEDFEDAQRAYEQIFEASKRAATLTSELLAFSRKRALQRRPVDLSALVHTCENMLGKLLGESYKLDLQCAESLPLTQADENCLVQVLMNLVANARDATPVGERICVSTSQVELDDKQASAFPEASPGTFVTLSVQDSGSGMDATVLSKIFDPFFTTKEQGRGTGLGLSVVLGIVKQHKGWVNVESRVNTGTTFTMFLPVATDPSEPEIPVDTTNSTETELPRGNGEVILVVEDESAVRDLACKVLTRHGYQVASAKTGREALDEWGTSEGQLDLLLTDVVMPGGVRGDQLARDLLAVRPGLKVICASGHSPAELTHDMCRNLGVQFLQKPYSFSDLLVLVRDCLADHNSMVPSV